MNKVTYGFENEKQNNKFEIYDIFDGNDNEISTNEEIQFTNDKMKIELKKKRKQNLNTENKDDNEYKYIRKDNIRNTIINNFFIFINSFLNEYLLKLFPKKKKRETFKKIDAKLKLVKNIESLNKIMNLSIKDLCDLDITPKNSTFPKNYNSSLLIKYSKLFSQDFLNLKLYQFYQDFYLNNDIELLRKKFGITDKTKNFSQLLSNKKYSKKYSLCVKEVGEQLTKIFEKKIGNNENNTNENIYFGINPEYPIDEDSLFFNFLDNND